MKVTQIVPPPFPGGVAVRVDPCDGACRGAHDIIVEALRVQLEPGHSMHVTLTWGVSVVLSIPGSQRFADGLNVALGIARQIEADGEYNGPPDVTIERVAP